MTTQKRFHFEPQILRTGKASAAFRKLLDEFEADTNAPIIIMRSSDNPDGSSTSDAVSLEGLGTLSDLTVIGNTCLAQFNTKDGRSLLVRLAGGPRGLANLEAQADTAEDAERALNILVRELGLEPPVKQDEPEVKFKEIEDLSHRLDILEQASSQARRLRCFLSYRFDDPLRERAAGQVERFLSLLDVEVVTGRGYEPRAIRDKLDERLQGLDFLVLLVASEGESFFTRDEITTARARGVFVIPIVLEGQDFFAGLFGDQEYIRYSEAHIGDAFLKLLEGVLYVRRMRKSP